MDTPNLVSEQEFREKLDETLERVADQGEVFLIARFGKPAVALVPIGLYTSLHPNKQKQRQQQPSTKK